MADQRGKPRPREKQLQMCTEPTAGRPAAREACRVGLGRRDGVLTLAQSPASSCPPSGRSGQRGTPLTTWVGARWGQLRPRPAAGRFLKVGGGGWAVRTGQGRCRSPHAHLPPGPPRGLGGAPGEGKAGARAQRSASAPAGNAGNLLPPPPASISNSLPEAPAHHQPQAGRSCTGMPPGRESLSEAVGGGRHTYKEEQVEEEEEVLGDFDAS